MTADHRSGPRPAGSLRDRRAIYAFGACWMAVPVMPVFVPFLRARGLGTADVLDLQAIYSLVVLAAELPTGLLADAIGRRRTLLLGAACNLAGATGFALADGFGSFAAAEVLLAAGWSLVSGADIALLYDVLDAAEADRAERRRALGAYTFAQVGGEAAAALFGGAVASSVSLAAAGWAAAAEALLPLAIASALPTGARPLETARATLAGLPLAARLMLADRRTALLFANTVVWGLSTFTAVWLLQPYWRSAGVGLGAYGPLWAGTLLLVGVAGRLAPRVLATLGGPRTLLLLAGLPPLSYAAMAASGGGALGVACGFGFYASRGLNAVLLREALNHRLPGALRASLNSLASGAARAGFAALGPLVGLVVVQAGLRTALASLALLFGAALLGLAIPLARRGAGMDAAGSGPTSDGAEEPHAP